MFIVSFLLITLPFARTMYSMEQQSITLWDPTGSEFCNYAALIRSNPIYPPIQSADKNTAIHQPVIQKPLVNNNTQMSDAKLTGKFEAFIEKYDQPNKKSSWLQRFLSELPNEEDRTKGVEMFLTWQFESERLQSKRCCKNATIIELLTDYAIPFPVNDFKWNTNGDKALHIAFKNNKVVLAELLISELHAQVDVINNRQETPLTLLGRLPNARQSEFWLWLKKNKQEMHTP